MGDMESSLEFSNSLNSVSSLPAHYRTFKVIVIGDSGVGKTCLTHRFCAGEFPCRTEATIGVDFCERMVDIEDEKIKLQLWDTAGQERFRKSMVPHYYRSVHAVLFVYDVSNPASFLGLAAWIEECRQNSLGQDIPRFLVGNKVDLRDNRALRADGQVSREKAQKFAEAHGMRLFETSAKNSPKNGMCAQGAVRDKGLRRNGEVLHQQDSVETMVMAVAAKMKRHKKNQPVNAIGSGSFKVSQKKAPEKHQLACTC